MNQIEGVRLYYVRIDGSDSNDGLSNTGTGAFLTIQKALNVVGTLDTAIYNVTINVGAGTYVATAGRNTIKEPLGTGAYSIIGDIANPSNVIISSTSRAFEYSNAVRIVKILGFRTAGAGNSISVDAASIRFQKIEFFATNTHLFANNSGNIIAEGNYEIGASASRHA